MKKHILILFHENANTLSVGSSGVRLLIPHWRDTGYKVTYQFGTKKFIPADLVFIHVDLSVVPEEYLAYADRYPIAINRGITDIRKSRISNNLVTSSDSWDGPVIVKSDLNHGGHPEFLLENSGSRFSNVVTRKLAALSRPLFSRNTDWKIRSSEDYKIFKHIDAVPQWIQEDAGLVIERFSPEFNNGLYVIRMYKFLGVRGQCRVMASNNPIVKSTTKNAFSYEEPPPIVKSWKKEFKLDYGKLDFVMDNGKPVLIDVNKTPGIGRSIFPSLLQRKIHHQHQRRSRFMATGIEEFFASAV